MLKFLTLIFIFALSLSAFDSIEILNPNITLHKSGYFKTNKDLTPQQALQISKTNKLEQLPKIAKSFGFDKDTYWFVFEISTNTNKNGIFLDVRDPLADNTNLYTFKNETLTDTQLNGFFVPIYQRDSQTFPIRFQLLNSDVKTTYLLKIDSQNPRYIRFSIGLSYEVDQYWNIQYFIYIFSFGVFVALSFYNLFLYFIVKDKSYLFYSLYMFGLFISTSIIDGFMSVVSSIFATNLTEFILLFLSIELIGLILFTEYFLNLSEKNNKLRLLLHTLLYFNIACAFGILLFGEVFKSFILVDMFLIYIFVLYAGIVRFIEGFKPALFFLLATGVGIFSLIFFLLTHQGVLFPLNLFTENLMAFGMVWDLIFLSFALAYRIRLLQSEKEQAQNTLAQKAKFTTIGETIGNIAHQWRQPLTELTGYINHINLILLTSDKPDKEALQKSIYSAETVIKHMSSVIDTFQNFFHKSYQERFEISSCIHDVLLFLQGELQNNHIQIHFTPHDEIYVKGHKDEFFQAIVVIINNAKDALIENGSQNPTITIDIQHNSSNVSIAIMDNGGGIKMDNLEDIFEPYITTKSLQGMGLGLYIARSVVETKMGGKISAQNTEDGAMFMIKLFASSIN